MHETAYTVSAINETVRILFRKTKGGRTRRPLAIAGKSHGLFMPKATAPSTYTPTRPMGLTMSYNSSQQPTRTKPPAEEDHALTES